MDKFYVGWEAPVQWFSPEAAGPGQSPPFDFVYFPDKPNTWKERNEKTFSCKAVLEAASQQRVYDLLRRFFGRDVIISFAKELTPDLGEHFERTQQAKGAVLYACFDEVT